MKIQFIQFLKPSFKVNRQERIHGYIRILFAICLFLTSYYFIISGCYGIVSGLLTKTGVIDLRGTPVGGDFVPCWAAAKLARSGDSSAVYSVPALHAATLAVIGTDSPRWAWNYPPTFLLIIFPLSFLPYLVSLLVWVIGTLFGYLLIIRYIAPHPITAWLFLGLPTGVYNLFAGQNGFFSTILLGGGLLILDRNPFAGGFLLGLLSFKPHLAGLLPIALIAGRCWRALGGFVIGAGGLAIISLMAFGAKTWIAFQENTPSAATQWQLIDLWVKMPTIYGLARLEGATFFTAAILQGIITLGAVSVMTWVWYRGAPLALRGSILTLCILLSSPYLFQYDLALLALPFAWLGWEVYVNNERRGQALLMLCWLLLYFSCFILVEKGLQVNPIIVGVMFSFTVYRILQNRQHENGNS